MAAGPPRQSLLGPEQPKQAFKVALPTAGLQLQGRYATLVTTAHQGKPQVLDILTQTELRVQSTQFATCSTDVVDLCR